MEIIPHMCILVLLLVFVVQKSQAADYIECYECTSDQHHNTILNSTTNCYEPFNPSASGIKKCRGRYCVTFNETRTAAGTTTTTRTCSNEFRPDICQPVEGVGVSTLTCSCTQSFCNGRDHKAATKKCHACKSESYVSGIPEAVASNVLCAAEPFSPHETLKTCDAAYCVKASAQTVFGSKGRGAVVVQRHCAISAPYNGCQTLRKDNVEITTCYCEGEFCNKAAMFGSPSAAVFLIGAMLLKWMF